MVRVKARPAVVLAAAAAFCAIFFWPGTFGGRSLASGDALVQGIPMLVAPAVLWDPLVSLGHPMYADPNEAFFYPVAIAARFVRLPFNLYMIAPFAFALCGLFGLVRRYTSSTSAGIVAALTFALGGFMISHAGHVNIDHPAAWSAIFFLALEELRSRPAARWPVAATAASFALCAVSGQPQILAFASAVAVCYIAVLGAAAPGGAMTFALRAGCAIVAGLGLSAILLVPEWQLAQSSVRRTLDMADMLVLSVPLQELPIRLVFPHALDADPRGGFTELSDFAGSIGLMLAIVGAIAFRRDRRAAFWSAIVACGIVLSTGNALGLGRLTAHVPLYDLFRIPGRHAYEIDLALAVLAGFGTAALIEKRTGWKSTAFAVGGLLLVAGLAAISLAFGRSDAIDFVRTNAPQAFDPRTNGSLLVPAACAIVGALLIATAPRIPARMLGPALAVAVCGDLFGFAWFSYWNSESTATDPLRPTALAAVMQTKLHNGERLVWLPGSPDSSGVAPNLNRIWNVAEAQGYSSLDVATVAKLLGMRPGSGAFDGANDAAFDLASVRFVAGPRTLQQTTSAAAPIGGPQLPYYVGAPISGAKSASVRIGLPAPVRADALAIVTALGNGAAIPQGAVVARVAIRQTAGAPIEREIRAGVETAEFAFDRPDVRGTVRHVRANVFSSAGDGHDYLAVIPFGKRTTVDALTISWVWNPDDRAAMSIHEAAFVDHASARGYPLPPGVGSMLLADSAHYDYEPSGAYDIFVNRFALPQVRLVSRARRIEGDDAIALVRETHNAGAGALYRTTAMLERTVELGPASVTDRVTTVRAEPGRADWRVSCAAPCLAVDSETAYPGWIATIDGAPAPIETVDGALRGVVVPSGRHAVSLRFHPTALAWGALVCAITMIGLVLWLLPELLSGNRRREGSVRE